EPANDLPPPPPIKRPPPHPLFPYTTLFRSRRPRELRGTPRDLGQRPRDPGQRRRDLGQSPREVNMKPRDRKLTPREHRKTARPLPRHKTVTTPTASPSTTESISSKSHKEFEI